MSSLAIKEVFDLNLGSQQPANCFMALQVTITIYSGSVTKLTLNTLLPKIRTHEINANLTNSHRNYYAASPRIRGYVGP